MVQKSGKIQRLLKKVALSSLLNSYQVRFRGIQDFYPLQRVLSLFIFLCPTVMSMENIYRVSHSAFTWKWCALTFISTARHDREHAKTFNTCSWCTDSVCVDHLTVVTGHHYLSLTVREVLLVTWLEASPTNQLALKLVPWVSGRGVEYLDIYIGWE